MPHEYIKHHTEERHPTTDETQTETPMTSTLPAHVADREPIPRSTKKKNSTSKQTSLSCQIITLPVPATVVVVICEPQGLSNPITMGIKTSKA